MKKKHNHKHLTLSDRIYIEQELLQGSSFTSIARTLRKDPSTISKEVQRHRELIPYEYFKDNCRSCINYTSCNRKHVCGNLYCNFQCFRCRKAKVIQKCEHYITWLCNKPSKPPYVCNSCPHLKACCLDKYLYSAAKAQKNYEKTLSQSRVGINITPAELQELNDLISPLILKGQPLSHIFAVHADEIPVCRRTLYNYLDQKVFQARNIDLPRRVRYKKRNTNSKPHTKSELNQTYRNKRTYIDFERFMSAHPDTDVVETC